MKKEKKKQKISPEMFFLIVSLLTGIFLCLVVPIGAGFDEDTHEARSWEISKGVFIPNQLLGAGPNFPSVFYELSYRQKYILEPIGWSYYQENLSRKIDWNNMINHQTRSNYFPMLYFPQALIFGLLGRVFDSPVILILFFSRILNLLLYVFICFFAIRMIPFGKWVLLTLALAPMAMTQASIISADPLTNGFSLLFIAYVLKLSRREVNYSNKEILLLLGVICILFMSKAYVAVLICLIFLLPQKLFQNKRQVLLLSFGIAALFLILIVGWNLIVFRIPKSPQEPGTIDAIAQLNNMINNPPQFFSALINTLKLNGINYIKEWVGVMGYRYWGYPTLIYPVFFLCLLFAIIKDSSGKMESKERFTFLVTFLIGFIATIIVFFLISDTESANSISGINGRYFIPFMPLLIFTLIIPNTKSMHDLPSGIVTSLIIGIQIMIIVSTFLAYHINCGTSIYSGGVCYLPVYKNWDPDQASYQMIKKDEIYSQTFLSKCSGLSLVKIWAKGLGPENDMRISVINLVSQQLVVENNKVQIDSVSGDWVVIPFSPQSDSNKTAYKILLNFDNDNNGSISLAVNSRNEYTEGEFLIINETNSERDIFFQYGCRSPII